jgi:hypothetical protein
VEAMRGEAMRKVVGDSWLIRSGFGPVQNASGTGPSVPSRLNPIIGPVRSKSGPELYFRKVGTSENN